MGHLNELQSRYGDKGLTVLAVTSEAAGVTEKWAEEKGAEYAYAYDKGRKLSRWFGVSGIPDAALIDPSGEIVWRGHPGGLNGGIIEEHLAGALPKPLWEWPASAKGVSNALLKQQYAKALKAAAKLKGDDAEEILAIIRSMIASKVAGLKAAHEKGDFLGAQERGTNLQKQLSGLPEADEAAKILAAIKANKGAKAIIKAQKNVAKIAAEVAELRKNKDADKLTKKLKKIMEKYPETYAHEEAKVLTERVHKMRKDLR